MRYLVKYMSESGHNEFEIIGIFSTPEEADDAKRDWIASNTIPQDELDDMLENGEIDQYEYDDHLNEPSYLNNLVAIIEIE